MLEFCLVQEEIMVQEDPIELEDEDLKQKKQIKLKQISRLYSR